MGRVLITWFNDCILDNSGQITNPIIVNPIIANIDPCRILVYAHAYYYESINCKLGKTCNL